MMCHDGIVIFLATTGAFPSKEVEAGGGLTARRTVKFDVVVLDNLNSPAQPGTSL